MEFIAATNNANKLAEFSRILGRMGHSVKSLAQLGLKIDPEETGLTFEENALIKAVEVCKATACATIADDSGLAVDALDGAPGVYSARFAGEHGNADANIQKLLQLLENTQVKNRTGRFISAVALALPGGATLVAQGECEGVIGFEPVGIGGFGYDPIFFMNGKSFAQMSEAEKDRVSHRAVALARFGEHLPDFLAQYPPK